MQSFDDTIGYAIKIGDEIEIRIVSVNGDQRRVAIGASKESLVDHPAIFERIQAEKRQAVAQ